jgi:hypothetical protein
MFIPLLLLMLPIWKQPQCLNRVDELTVAHLLNKILYSNELTRVAYKDEPHKHNVDWKKKPQLQSILIL